METIEDIIKEMRCGMIPKHRHDRELLMNFANRIEAAHKREADSIHRAMVLIAGIEMEDSENPPRLWTALEDAYDELSDALGTDGETTADVAEAKSIGRHFVIKPVGNASKMREALEKISRVVWEKFRHTKEETEAHRLATEALTVPIRNCDAFSKAEILEMLDRRSFSKEDTIEWLYAEKGVEV